MLRSRRRKKLIVQRNPAGVATRPNQIWGLDFVFDTTEFGRSVEVLGCVGWSTHGIWSQRESLGHVRALMSSERWSSR